MAVWATEKERCRAEDRVGKERGEEWNRLGRGMGGGNMTHMHTYSHTHTSPATPLHTSQHTHALGTPLHDAPPQRADKAWSTNSYVEATRCCDKDGASPSR